MITQALMSCRQPAGYTSLDGGRHTPGPGWRVCCRDWHEMHEVHGGRPGEEDEDGCLRWGDLHHCRSVTLQLFNNRLVVFQMLVLPHASVVISFFDCFILNSKHGIVSLHVQVWQHWWPRHGMATEWLEPSMILSPPLTPGTDPFDIMP